MFNEDSHAISVKPFEFFTIGNSARPARDGSAFPLFAFAGVDY